MKNQKHFFNMVEVALALLVISLGLSTVLTLFPAGLKATSEAENANNVVEAAEFLFAYLQKQGINNISAVTSRYEEKITTSSTRWITSPKTGVYVFRKFSPLSSGNVEDFSCVAQILEVEDKIEPDSSTGAVAYLPALTGSGFSESGSRTRTYSYLFSQQTSGEIDCTSSAGNEINLCKIIDVEFSYPASEDYYKRTKRTYRMCVLNTNCDFYKKTTTP